MEVLRLDDKQEIQKLARGQHEREVFGSVDWWVVHCRLEDAQELGENHGPEVGQVLGADTAHQHAQAEVNLGMHAWSNDVGTQDFDELLLDAGQLGEMVVTLGCEKNK